MMRHLLIRGIAASLLIAGHAMGQSQPATVPTIVAQSVSFGHSQYFDGQTPTGWPVALVPQGARILGGASTGDPAPFHLLTAVFEFPSAVNPREAVHALLVKAGYTPPAPPPPRGGGFVSNDLAPISDGYCSESLRVTFAFIDSASAPSVIAIHLMDGVMARQGCAPQPPHSGAPPQVRLPALSPPSGVRAMGGGGSWSGDAGNTRTTLWTTLGTDSILFHYTAQLVAGGWQTQGRPAIGEGIAAQRFSFRQGQDDWWATLTVTTAGERREVMLQYVKQP